MTSQRPFRRGAQILLLILVSTTLSLAGGCKSRERSVQPLTSLQTSTPAGLTSNAHERAVLNFDDVDGEELGQDIFVSEPKQYDNLVVFPILAKRQADLGPLVSLHAALQQKVVEVRELGATDMPNNEAADNVPIQQQGQPSQPGQPAMQQQARGGGSASVNTLALENKGAVPVYVLAGTIVKGGNQDRQIGQDFIIGPKETVPIDAFCVEHGRWNGTRDGSSTDGKFEAVQQLANKEVRVAGQYKKNQSEVWSKVSKVNEANGKKSASDSLLATADDGELNKKRDVLRAQVLHDLDAVNPAGAVVGYAYAIGGEVQGVRWFANHRVFGMFRDVLINTAIVDALTAKASGATASRSVSASRVAQFVLEAQSAPPARVVETAADNVNEYAESADAYSSKTSVKPKGKPKVNVSHDFSKK